MSFKETFSKRHVVLPVVHVETKIQAERNTKIAEGAGADGVFLIDMRGKGFFNLLTIYEHVQEKNPNFWIGLNFLDINGRSVFYILPKTSKGVWTDNAMIRENDPLQAEADFIATQRAKSSWPGLYFGGVAFKYQNQVMDVEKMAREAAKFMDVVTTSGAGTGQAADIGKIRAMKSAIGSTPLAIASGISARNVEIYLDFADCFLVASSLLVPGTDNFDEQKVKELVKAVNE